MLSLGSGTLKVAPWYAGGQVQAPATVVLSQAAAGGSLSNGTYYVAVTAFNVNGESTPFPEQSIVLNGGGAAQEIIVTVTAPASGPAPTGYRVYIGTVAGFSTAQGTTAGLTYTQTAALTTTGAQSRLVGLITVGEVGGDADLDVNWQSKDFYGQSAFPITRAFYGGKGMLRAKKVEPRLEALDAIVSALLWSQLGTVGSGSDVYSLLNTNIPGFLYVAFVHTRSDAAGKTVQTELFKASCKQFLRPFIRDDIGIMDWEFDAAWDSTISKFITVTATQ